MKSLWKFLTSLKLTVVCLLLGVVLVFIGTLAQVNEGLYNAQDRWFKSFFIWWGPAGAGWQIPVFPAGYTVGIVLVINLLAAHINRFQWHWKKLGIHLTHAGILLLLLGQLATDMLSRESHMRMHEGVAMRHSESSRESELIFATDKNEREETIVSVPESIVSQKREIAHAELPFKVRVTDYALNGDVVSHSAIIESANRLTQALATVEAQYATPEGLIPAAERSMDSTGRRAVWREALQAIGEPVAESPLAAAESVAKDPAKEAKLRSELKSRFQAQMIDMFSKQGGAPSYAATRIKNGETLTAESLQALGGPGVNQNLLTIRLPEAKTMDARNIPWAAIEIVSANGGEKITSLIVSPVIRSQEFTIGEKRFRTELRFERFYKPFSLTLLKATHEVYRGTDIPKNFQSRVRLQNPETGENREVDIYMNNPLRYAGLTFYQYQMGKEEAANSPNVSTLMVVRNPSWLTPYLGCAVVSVGMLYQFLYHLVSFIGKRRKRASEPDSAPRKKGGKGRNKENALASTNA